MLRKYKNTWRLLACFAVLYVLLCAAGLLDKQKIWPGVEVEWPQGKSALSLADGDVYSTVTSGPYDELPVGIYRLKWQIEGDGVNIVRLMDSNEVEISPSVFETTPGTFEGEGWFEIKDTIQNFNISVEFCDGTWIAVHNFRLYSPVYRDNYITLAILMAATVLLVWLYEGGKLPRARREILVVLLIVTVFSSVPALREDTVGAFDVPFHGVRLRNLMGALTSGQFPARVGGYSYNGYGAVTSIFYPDLLLIPFALLLKLGASMTYVLNVLTITINVLTALCMYIAGKRIFRDSYAGAFAAIIYVCCGFRLHRFYGSFMVGQMLAMAFFPLFMLGLWEVFFGDKERWIVLVIAATLIFQSHLLTTLMCAGVAAAAVLFFGVKLWKERRVKAVLLAIAATLLLNLTTLVPMATTYLSGVTTSVNTYGFINVTHELVTMLGTDKELGLAMVLGLAALVCVDGSVIGRERRRMAIILSVPSVLCIYMGTDMFPWSYVFALTNNFFEIFQFSWRFLVIATTCLALCAGLGYACLLRDTGTKGLLAVLAVAVLCATPIIEDALEEEVVVFGTETSPYMLYPEYQFEGTDLVATRSRQMIIDGDVQTTGYEKDGTRIRVHIDAPAGGTVTFPLFGFEGYEAQLNGETITWERGENNRLAVTLPAASQGELTVRYAGVTLWRITDLISLASALALGLWVLMRKKRRLV